MIKKETIGIGQIVLAQFLIAVIYILVRIGKNFGTYNLAFFRIFFGVIFIGLLFIFIKKYKLAKIKGEKGKLLVFGIFHGLIVLSSFVSINYLSLATSVLLMSTISIWTVVFSYFLLREKISKMTLLALVISFIGVIILINPNNIFITNSLVGIIAGLFVGIGGGFIYTLSKTFKNYDKISLTFWQNLIAVPFLVPLLFIKMPIFALTNLIVALLIGFLGALSFILMYAGFGLIKGQKGGVLILLNSIFTIILALLFFTEIPSLQEIIGGIFILIGSYIVTR